MKSRSDRVDVAAQEEEEFVPAAAAQPITMLVEPPKRNDDVPRGIAFMVAATVLFSVSSAFAKWQVARYPVGEVMFIRSFSSLVVCAAFILPFTGLSVFATRRPRDHIARGLSQSISQTFSVIAFSMMPLAGAVAINFSAPLWSALLSVVWLKERAGPVRWLVLLAGFLGVLIVTNPGADSLQVGALFARRRFSISCWSGRSSSDTSCGVTCPPSDCSSGLPSSSPRGSCCCGTRPRAAAPNARSRNAGKARTGGQSQRGPDGRRAESTNHPPLEPPIRVEWSRVNGSRVRHLKN
jgi:uncharacterized membrane protein